uniref:Multiple C2 and transmembrane domain-containing protein 1 n=1 Tax=Haemonchus contortus TaxID=6289 RepID=A0A7I4XT71_HAECO
MPPRRRRVSWLERPVAMAPMEGTSDSAHLSPVHAKSAGCSPMFSRRLRFLGCAGPSFDSPYQLGELAEVHEIVAEMSPRVARSRLRRIFASLTPSKKPKSLSSLDSDHRFDDNEILTVCETAKPANVDEKEEINYVALLVKIRLKEGQNLAIRDASGSSDPYVKFKYKDRIMYKSSTIYKNLNPIWDEEFQMLADDMTSPIIIEVFDYDRFCTDDFMGSCSIDISQVKWFQSFEKVVDLYDDASPNEELGTISLTISVIPLTTGERDEFVHRSVRGVLSEVVKKREKLVQTWVSVVNVVLVEGRNLNVSYNAVTPPDPYCKFKLGCEKYKSKICTRTSDPKWVEQFDLHIYELGSETLEVMCQDKHTNTSIGRIAVDLHTFPRDQTIQKWYHLEDTSSALLLLITVSGSQSKDTVVDLTEFNQNDIRNSICERYDLLHTFDDLKDVGQLTVKVFRAEDLVAKDIGGKSDPFAVLELVNTRLQTHTEYKTLNPQWNKLFTFSVKDIHTCLEVTVYDEDPNNKFEFLGRVSIPLLSIKNCERKWYALKNKKLTARVKGEILLELDVIWNPIRAAIRTFNPRERKILETDKKFKASLFRNTVVELKEFGLTLVDYKNYVVSCFDWESTSRSVTAFVIFVVGVYFFELYHAPMLLLVLFARCLVYKRVAEDLAPRVSELSFREDDDVEEEKSSTTIRDTLSSVQETLAVVQNTLVFICALLQRIRNAFNFSQPWLSWLAVGVLIVATILLYLVPLRWIIMLWGINKFTKKLRNPHYIDNNEVLDYLSRVPCDRELMEWREYKVKPSSNGKEKEKSKLKDK